MRTYFVTCLMASFLVPPLKADILSKERRFVTGDSSEIKCETYGSRPTASISWWKDNIRLPDTSYKVKYHTALADQLTSKRIQIAR